MAYTEPESIELIRDVNIITVPDGINSILRAGETVTVMQSLGSSITVTTSAGAMVRISGSDADALGKEPVLIEGILEGTDQDTTEANIWNVLRTVYDPEIPVNIVELGLVYDCKITPVEDDLYSVDITMTLTAAGCGMGPILQSDVESGVKQLAGVSTVNVEVVFDPPWDRAMMSEAAQLQLGMF